MAKGKSTYAGLYCPESGMLLKTVWYLKSKKSLQDIVKKVYSPKANKRVVPKAKDIKRSS